MPPPSPENVLAETESMAPVRCMLELLVAAAQDEPAAAPAGGLLM